MAKHLIVSCGTSQIEELKLGKLEVNNNTKSYCKMLVNNRDCIINAETVNELSNRAETVDLITKLVEKYCDLPQSIGKSNNPFGAEVSTLWKMHEEEKICNQDWVTLLYSDTIAGAFSAAVLKGFLTKSEWNMQDEQVILRRVSELREEFRRPAEAESNLVRGICSSLKRNEACPDVLVVTGGFKSVIPFFTLIAITKGIDMYYLYEQSENLCRLNLSAFVKVPERVSFLRKLASCSNQDDTTVVLRTILEECDEAIDITQREQSL